ncbi:MAG: transposase family protein [Cellulomonas sp.]|nr:transposase family protein [Cellulomonas sp.]
MSDPRTARGVRYPIVAMLVVVACAMLAGARSYTTPPHRPSRRPRRQRESEDRHQRQPENAMTLHRYVRQRTHPRGHL